MHVVWNVQAHMGSHDLFTIHKKVNNTNANDLLWKSVKKYMTGRQEQSVVKGKERSGSHD